MKKKLFLLSIILFPSLIYLFFEMTKANFKKMAYFGPKKVIEKGDTVYYSVPNIYFTKQGDIAGEMIGDKTTGRTIKTDSLLLDTVNYPIYVILFVDSKKKNEGYKLSGMYDYLKYKADKIREVPILITAGFWETTHYEFEFDSLKISAPNFHYLMVDYTDRQKFLSETYFKQKPIHVFDYFLVLVDKQRHIRGYYDPTYNAEITRMIADYKHLKIRDGYAQTLKQNDIKQN